LNRICVLTDSLIQFPSPIFKGREIIYIIDYQLKNKNENNNINNNSKEIIFPKNLFYGDNFSSTPIIISPSVDQITKKIESLSIQFDYIICFSSSKKISEFYQNCQKAIEYSGLQSKVFLLDSNSISLGQGILCQKLVELINDEININVILEKMRQESKNIYAIFYLKNFSYLYRSDLLPYPSAILAEMKKIKNTFVFENGTFYATEKAKSIKNIIDIFENYANEFDSLEKISILQSKPSMSKITQPFKERITNINSNFEISEQIISPYLSSILGPESTGVFFYEPLLF
jgi:DegV family protein with EDD domain